MVTWLVACAAPSPNDAGVPDTAPLPLAADAFCVRVMSALNEEQCGYRLRCCTQPERDRLGAAQFTWPVAWACDQPLAARTSACTQALTSAAFDPSRAGACAAAIDAHPSSLLCNGPDGYYGQPLPQDSSDACAGIAGPTGARPAGLPCAHDSDCGHDTYCAAASDGGMAVCRYRQQNGEPCAPDGFGAASAPSCRSTWCMTGVCLPVCIGAMRGG